MNQIIKEKEVICWKLYTKKAFIDGIIDELELDNIYSLNFDISNVDDIEIIKSYLKVIGLVIDDVENKDNQMLLDMIQKDIQFVVNGSTHENFQKEWICYLYECFSCGKISIDDYKCFKHAIDFTKQLNEDDRLIIDHILDILRVKIVKNDPQSIKEFDSPSFDMLMSVNDMEGFK